MFNMKREVALDKVQRQDSKVTVNTIWSHSLDQLSVNITDLATTVNVS